MHGALKVQHPDELGDIVGVSVRFVAVPWLTGPSVSSPIMRDAPLAALREEEHLVLPSV